MDLYYLTAKHDSLCPVVIYTHGGGGAAGSKQGAANGPFKVVFEILLDHGFAIASVNYRLRRPSSGITMRDCVIDSNDRYLTKNSDTLKSDRTRLFARGDSAGGKSRKCCSVFAGKFAG